MTASRLVCAGLLAVFLGGAGRARADAPRPAAGPVLYEGRPLRDWLADLKDPDALVREEAIEVLGQAGKAAREAVPQLEKLLREESASGRVRIAVALWHIDGRTKGVAKVLAECLSQDEGPINRTQALVYLGKLGAEAAPAVDAILGLLDTTDYSLRTQVTSTLQQLGAAAAPAIVKALGSKKSNTRHSAILYLMQHYGTPLPGSLDALAKLLKDADVRIRSGAAMLLWRHEKHTEAVAAVLVEAVRSPDQNIRQQLVNTVFAGPGIPVPKTARPIVKAGLASPDAYVRMRSAQALWQLDRKVEDVLPLFIKGLEDNNYMSWSQAALGIAQIGPAAKSALPALAKRLKAGARGYISYEIFNALVALGPDAIPPLADALKTPGMNPGTRNQAAQALARIGPKAVPALVPLLKSSDNQVRNAVCQALGTMGSNAKEAVPALVKLLDDRDAGLRQTALRTLGQMGPAAREAHETIGKLAADKDARVRAAALLALGQILPEPRALLAPALAAIEDRDASVQLRGLELLVQADPRHPKLQPTVLALLEQPALRSQVLNVVPRLGAAGAGLVPALVDLLNGKELGIRFQVMNALGQMGPAAREAVPALVAALKDPNLQIRIQAIQTLNNLRSAAGAAVPALARLLKDPDTNLRNQALSALVNMGSASRRAVPSLIPLLRDGSAHERHMAVMIVGNVGPGAHAALPELLRLLDQADATLQSTLFNTLRTIRSDADGKLIAEKVTSLIENKKITGMWSAAALLGDLGRDAAPAVPLLLAEFKKPALPYRLALAEALARIDPKRTRKEVVPVLEQLLHTSPASLPVAATLERIDPGNKEALAAFHAMLKDKNSGNRAHAAALLGGRGTEAKWAVPALRKALTDETSQVRIVAAGALWQITGDARTVLPVLLRELKQAEPAYLRNTAALKLGDMGAEARSAVPTLLEILRSGDAPVRSHVLNALNRIDPEAAKRGGSRIEPLPPIKRGIRTIPSRG